MRRRTLVSTAIASSRSQRASELGGLTPTDASFIEAKIFLDKRDQLSDSHVTTTRPGSRLWQFRHFSRLSPIEKLPVEPTRGQYSEPPIKKTSGLHGHLQKKLLAIGSVYSCHPGSRGPSKGPSRHDRFGRPLTRWNRSYCSLNAESPGWPVFKRSLSSLSSSSRR